MRFAHFTNDVVDDVIRASQSYIDSLPNSGEWRKVDKGVNKGWIWSGTEAVSPYGGEPKPDPESTPRYRLLVTPDEFVDLFPARVYLEIKQNFIGTHDRITQLYESAFLKDTINLASPKLTQEAIPFFLAQTSLTQAEADTILQGVLE